MSMADLIQWARTAQRTGVITVRRAADPAERKIFLQNGQIIACASSDPREYYGHYLARLGYCTEADVDRALQIQTETGVMVAAILVMVGQLSRDDAVATLTDKTIDIICDIFLWSGGSFEYDPNAFEPRKFIPLSLDPISVALEGVRRVDRWDELRTVFHSGAIFEATGTASSPGAILELPKSARLVLPLLDGQTTVDELAAGLPFSKFSVLESLSGLTAEGLARSIEVTAVVSRRRLEMKLEEALAAGRRDNWGEAVQILEGLAAMNSEFPSLGPELARAREMFKSRLFETTFHPDDVPVVSVGMDALQRLKLSPADGFVISRIDGRLHVAEVLRISSLPEMEGLRSLKRLLDAKVIDFPSRRSSRV